MTLVRFTSIANFSAALAIAAGLAFAAPAQAQAGKAKAGKTQVKGDPVHGAVVFNQCKACHSLDAGKNGVGPTLKGIVGTKAAEVPGYSFSPAMKKSGLTWTPQALSEYLTAPMKKVPGTKMPFGGLANPKDRDDVIAYLAKN
ncbi:MAG: cytochrome c family protein [Sphingobium sp.]|nr:cytochrome c family protein [Sphingobium sp.]